MNRGLLRLLTAPLLLFFLVLVTGDPLSAQPDPDRAVVEDQGLHQDLGELPLPEVHAVVDHLDNLYRSRSSHSTMRMTVVTENWSRTLELEAWTQGEDNALIIIRAPAREAGTGTLRTADGLWNYAPRADQLVRIPSGLLSESWMGSHFTNDDLMRESSYLADHEAILAWVEEDGSRYLRVALIPHPDTPVVYTRLEFLLAGDRWVPIRADFFDGEECVRTFTFSDVREVSQRSIPFVMEVIPHDKPGESTRVEYLSHQIDIQVDGSLFLRQGLRRAAQRR
ncbi:MAG: outer membrane lipoprotein-sorting protein [Bradymonadales bacterium]|nr:outer membrane lipoprotein-sorting protein [Bradymonadales bacterium]